MRGYRKLIIAAGIVLCAIAVPLNEHQADVLLGVVYATMGANAAVHVGSAISGAVGVRRDGSAGSRGGSPGDSIEEQG